VSGLRKSFPDGAGGGFKWPQLEAGATKPIMRRDQPPIIKPQANIF